MRYLACLAVILFIPAFALQNEGSFDRSFNVSGAVDLDVQTHSGRITVRAGDSSTVRVHGIIRPNGGRGFSADLTNRIREIESNPPVTQSGNSIRISALQDEWLRRRISISYEITTPAASKLRARTGSGGVSADGVRGPVDVSTGSGGVEITHIGDEVRAQTGSGRIRLDSIQGRVDAHTGSGTVEARAVAGPTVVHTGSGSLRLEQTAAGSVTAHTGSGSINLRLPASAGFDLQAHTGTGHIYCDQPLTVSGNIGGRELRGKVRGGGPLVDVSTGSGPIRIE